MRSMAIERCPRVIFINMNGPTPVRRVIRTERRGRPRDRIPKVMLPVKMTPDLRKRFKMRCAGEDVTYGEMIEYWMDRDDEAVRRQRRQQAHPLHRPNDTAVSM